MQSLEKKQNHTCSPARAPPLKTKLMWILRDQMIFCSLFFLAETCMLEGQYCLQSPQWDEFRNSVQGHSTSKKPHSSVLVTWTPGIWWLFLDLQNLPPFPTFINPLGSSLPKLPSLRKYLNHMDLMAIYHFTTFPWKLKKKLYSMMPKQPHATCPAVWNTRIFLKEVLPHDLFQHIIEVWVFHKACAKMFLV